jgi:hypothetical protein
MLLIAEQHLHTQLEFQVISTSSNSSLRYAFTSNVDAVRSVHSEAGTRPGRRGTFLARASKVPKRTRPFCPCPCASLRASSVLYPRAAPWNSLRATRFTRTTTASQITKQLCPSAQLPAPGSARQAMGKRGKAGTEYLPCVGCAVSPLPLSGEGWDGGLHQGAPCCFVTQLALRLFLFYTRLRCTTHRAAWLPQDSYAS